MVSPHVLAVLELTEFHLSLPWVLELKECTTPPSLCIFFIKTQSCSVALASLEFSVDQTGLNLAEDPPIYTCCYHAWLRMGVKWHKLPNTPNPLLSLLETDSPQVFNSS